MAKKAARKTAGSKKKVAKAAKPARRTASKKTAAKSTGKSGKFVYQFGKKTIHHLFCPTCGIRSFARGTGPETG